MATQNALANIDKTAGLIDEVVQKQGIQTLLMDKALAGLKYDLAISAGTARLGQLITTDFIQQFVYPLMNSPLGFKADKDYPVETVRQIVIGALMSGVRLSGNQFNILFGGLYITKNGLGNILSNMITDLDIKIAVPRMAPGGAVVECEATFKFDGKDMKVECLGKYAIAVKLEKPSVDAASGKATRKLLKKIFDKITSSRHTLEDGDVEDIGVDLKPTEGVVVDSTANTGTEGVKTKMRQRSASAPKTQPESEQAKASAEVLAEQEPLAEPELANTEEASETPPPEEPQEPIQEEHVEPAKASPPAATSTAKPAGAPTGPKGGAAPAATKSGGAPKGPAGKAGGPAGGAPAQGGGVAKTAGAQAAGSAAQGGGAQKATGAPAGKPASAGAKTTTAAPAAAKPAQSAPVEEQEEDVSCYLANVTVRRKKKADGTEEVQYVLTSENRTQYLAIDKEIALQAREALEKKQKVDIFYVERVINGTTEYFITQFAVSIDEAAPPDEQQQDSPPDDGAPPDDSAPPDEQAA